MTHQPTQEQLEAKVRKLFRGRTHKAPKIEVEVVPALRKYKTIIAPYEPTVEAITALIQEAVNEGRVAEWERILEAEVTHGGTPAPFNPEGLPIVTSRTQELTEVLRSFAKDRIKELNSGGSNNGD